MFKPGFSTTVLSWIAAILSVVWPGHPVTSLEQVFVTAAAGIITAVHIHGKWAATIAGVATTGAKGASDIAGMLNTIAKDLNPPQKPPA